MVGTDVPAAAIRPGGRAAKAIRDLPPAAFAFVMATGIVSAGTYTLGPVWVSRTLLTAATVGLVVLAGMLLVRLGRYRPNVAADARAPEKTFGFFTIVAGINVLGVRFASAGHPTVTAGLAALGAGLLRGAASGPPASLPPTPERGSGAGGGEGTRRPRGVGAPAPG